MGNIQNVSHLHYLKPSSEALELKLNVSILILYKLMGDRTCRRYNRTCSYSCEGREYLGNGIHFALAATPLSVQKGALVHVVPTPL
jgi:hypothetical protein